MERILTQRNIEQFYTWLKTEEKSRNTIEKYIRDVTAFESFLAGAEVMKETVIAYKKHICFFVFD